MTHAEVLELTAGILDRWPHAKLTDGVIDQYRRVLAEVLPEHAAIAVETWCREGERFAPSAAEVLGRVADLALDAPDWGVVKALLERRAADGQGRLWSRDRLCPLRECDGSGLVQSTDDVPRHEMVVRHCPCRITMRAEAAAKGDVPPVVADFLERVVSSRDIDDMLNGDDFTRHTVEAQVRRKYEAHVRGIRRQVVFQGLPDGGLEGMRRLASEAAERLPKLLPGGGDRDRQPHRIGDAMRAITERSA